MLTIYKASAGSGKTFTLTYEYIRTLLGVKEQGASVYHLNSDKYTPGGHRRANRHRGILAITFTNAATEEMKSRIVRELAKLAGPATTAESPYSKRLIEDFGCTAEELRLVAEKALSEILYDYGSFNVSTIDSFFQMVLRTFSREVDHQGDYELSVQTDNVIKQSISLMLDELNYSSPKNSQRLFSWIQQYTLGRLKSGVSYNFFQREGRILRDLAKFTSNSLDETYSQYSKELREYLEDPARIGAFRAALNKKIDVAYNTPLATATEFFDSISAAGISELCFNRTIVGRANQLVSGVKMESVTGKTFLDCVTGKKTASSLVVKTQLKGKPYREADLESYCQILAKFAREVYVSYHYSQLYIELEEHLGILDFIGLALRKLEDYLRDTNTVLLSDTGDLLRRIINDSEMPFIYERLGMKLTNLLIDEFQDTSHLQWHNLKPLVANSLAEGHDDLIIGDEKQSIYRFRNTDSELLGSIVQTRDFPNDFKPRGSAPEDNTNRRSAHGIVRANNTIFSRMARALDAKSYANVVQTPWDHLSDRQSYVSITFLDDDYSVDATLERMVGEIVRQHESGYAWRDILILARKRCETAAIVEYLTTYHPEIRVLSSESLLLSSSSAVRTIISMLKLVERSYVGRKAADESAPAYASRSDIVMMITRFNYFRAEGYEIPEALRLSLDSSGDAVESLDKEIMSIRAENPANLVALIDAIILHKVPAQQRRDQYAFIAALQDQAIKHSESADSSLSSFLKDYDNNINEWAIQASSDLDAVEVMTIHKSKGLERDCVHIPFADWELVHNKQSTWISLDSLEGFDKNIIPPILRAIDITKKSVFRNPEYSPFAATFDENDYLEKIDNLNNAYVAFTRAGRELIVYSKTKKIGGYLLDAITLSADSEEQADYARIDLASLYDSENKTLTIGGPTQKEAKKNIKPTVESGEYPVIFRSDARELTSIDDAFSTHLDIGGEEDKIIVDKAEYSDVRMQQAAKRGSDLHAILASIRTIEGLSTAVAEYSARVGLDDATQAEYLAELSEAITDGGTTVARWFAPGNKVYAERTIYVAETGMSFRPDRMVVCPDGTTSIIDYKFTTEPRPEHFAQVENYVKLMTQLGYANVKAFLWYPLLKRVLEVV